MKWTKIIPAKSGWYWYRGKHCNKPVIVEMEAHHTMGTIFRDGRLPRKASIWGGEWAGPIEEPKE